jgi:hypothetical protein
MQRAVEWRHVAVNPVRAVRKPVQRREREIRPLAPSRVEALREVLGPRDATLVSVLAESARYAGLSRKATPGLEPRDPFITSHAGRGHARARPASGGLRSACSAA